MDLGLYYYNARFYLPGIGRFASADTIVPDPMNPQQYNRYTYTLNNPLRFTDPTGHCAGDPGEGSCYGQLDYFVDQIYKLSGGMYHVDPRNWTYEELSMILQGVGQIMNGLTQQAGSTGGARALLADLFNGQSVSIRRTEGSGLMGWSPTQGAIHVFDGGFSNLASVAWNLAHETGHVIETTWASAAEFMQFTGGIYTDDVDFLMTQFGFTTREEALWAAYIPGSLSRDTRLGTRYGSWTYNARRHPSEDLAETMAYGFLCGTGDDCRAAHAAGNSIYPGTVRMDYYQMIIDRARGIGR